MYFWALQSSIIYSTFYLKGRELGIAIVAYSPLGRGFLTGQITKSEDLSEDDWRKTGNPRFAPEAIENNLKMV